MTRTSPSWTGSPTAHRRLLPVAVGVTTAVLAGACSAPQDGSEAGPETPSASSGAALQQFYDQEIAFGSCEGFASSPTNAEVLEGAAAECGHLLVPVDYADPEGPTARIAVSRVPARSGPATGSVVLNPGGPGISGISFSAVMTGVWSQSPITEQYDLVGFDPRGVGVSTPSVECYDDAERDASVLPGNVIGDGIAAAVPLAEACADSVGGEDVLGHIGTRDTARDVDVLRSALGEDQLTYAAMSYGTRLGAVYAEMFPERVRAMVLDGAIDPRYPSSLAHRVDQQAGFQRAFDVFAAACAEQPTCPLGTDPSQATAAFNRLAQPLGDNPVPTSDGRPLTFVAAVDGLTNSLYNEAAWPQAIQGLTELQQGRGDTLLALRDEFQGRASDGTYAQFLEATYAINCADEDHLDPAQHADFLRALVQAAPYATPPTPIADEVADDCTGWPPGDQLGHPYAQDVEGFADTLTISVTGDATTPYEGGVRLAESLGGSLLTVEANLHGALIAGNACVDEAVTSYLLDGVSPGPDATCRL
jgi:pimeloyl-ACP methyl ester carboxylesterase